MNEIIKTIFMNSTFGKDYIKFDHNNEYARLNKKEDELYNKLETSLSPELFKLFDEFINTLLDQHAIIDEHYYIAGFKIGLLLATEAFDLSNIFNS